MRLVSSFDGRSGPVNVISAHIATSDPLILLIAIV
jgi:hypothetical protein